MSRTKASFSQFQCTCFQGSLARNAFLKDSGCAKYVVLQDKKRASENGLGRSAARRATLARRSRLCPDHVLISPLLELTVPTSFSQLQVAVFEGSLAGKFRCHQTTD